jgi:hypothetical protein
VTAAELTRARTAEDRLRADLNRLVRERLAALADARRAEDLGRLPGADPSLGETAARFTALAGRLEVSIEEARTALRRQQAEVERLRADAAGA